MQRMSVVGSVADPQLWRRGERQIREPKVAVASQQNNLDHMENAAAAEKYRRLPQFAEEAGVISIVRIVCLSLLMLLIGFGTAGAQEYAGWPTDALLAKATQLLGSENITEQAGSKVPQMMLLDPTEEATCFAGTSDRVRVFVVGDFSTMLLIGDDTSIHTLWFYFPILGVRDTDAAFKFYDGFLSYLFPDWNEADGWALQSLQRSWKAGGAAFEDPTISLDAMIARDNHAGARLAGWGVPPDIMTYRITTRAHCEKISVDLLASPRRVPRIESQRKRTQAEAQLLLNYLHPQPIDFSETPIYLGRLSGFRSIRSIDETIRLDATGYLGDRLVALDAWIEDQATDPFASTQDFLAEGWGYEPQFLMQIDKPLLWVDTEMGDYRALVDHLSVDVSGSIEGPYRYRPSSLEGLLFSRSVPTAANAQQRLGPPYMNLNAGQIGYGVEGRAAPVDISDTPLYLGALRGRGGSLQLPAPFEGTIKGLVVTLRDTATGESAGVDLAAWLAGQTGTAPGPSRLSSITEPSIGFRLGQRQYRLVIELATFNEAANIARDIDLFAAALFGSALKAP